MVIEGATKEALVATWNILGTLVSHRQCCQSWGESTEQNQKQADIVWAAVLGWLCWPRGPLTEVLFSDLR